MNKKLLALVLALVMPAIGIVRADLDKENGSVLDWRKEITSMDKGEERTALEKEYSEKFGKVARWVKLPALMAAEKGKDLYWSQKALYTYGATIALGAAAALVAEGAYSGNWEDIKKVALACVGIASDGESAKEILASNKRLAVEIYAFMGGTLEALIGGGIYYWKNRPKTDPK